MIYVRLNELMRMFNTNINKVSEHTNINESTLNELSKGSGKSVSFDTLNRLASFFALPVKDIMGEKSDGSIDIHFGKSSLDNNPVRMVFYRNTFENNREKAFELNLNYVVYTVPENETINPVPNSSATNPVIVLNGYPTNEIRRSTIYDSGMETDIDKYVASLPEETINDINKGVIQRLLNNYDFDSLRNAIRNSHGIQVTTFTTMKYFPEFDRAFRLNKETFADEKLSVHHISQHGFAKSTFPGEDFQTNRFELHFHGNR